MDVIKTVVSPNYTATEIPVSYVVLHYTAADLARTLAIFSDPSKQVSSHLVIGRGGEVYETVQCVSGPALRAWHAGVSRMVDPTGAGGRTLEGFNDFSIGIELVNPNGNVFPYTELQYQALIEALRKIQVLYPSIDSPAKIVGHDAIAAFRGKCDPGVEFNWRRVFEEVFPQREFTLPVPPCEPRLVESLRQTYSELGITVDPASKVILGLGKVPPGVLEGISSLLEAAIANGYSLSSRK